MSGFRDALANGLGTIIKTVFRSPDYSPGVSGWSINKDGSVEFNNGTFRGTVTAGTFQGTDFVITSAGAFFYAGTPAAGNLIAAIAQADGHDPYGNPYFAVASFGNTSGAFTQVDQFGDILLYDASGVARLVLNPTTGSIKGFDGTGTQIMAISPTTASINITGSIKVINAALPSFYMLCDGGSITLNDGVVTAGAALSISDGSGSTGAALIVQSPQQTTNRAAFKLIAKSPDGTVAPFCWMEQDIRLTGDLWHATGAGGIDTWTALPLTNSWSNAGNPPAAQYRRISSPPNSIEVVGRIAHAAVSGTSQLATALPAGFRPANTQDLPIAVFGNSAAPVASPVLTLDTAGVLTFFNLPTGTTGSAFHLIYSLDA